MKWLVCLLFLACICTASEAETLGDHDWLLAGERAFLVMPPEVAALSCVRSYGWSSNGEYLLAVQEEMTLSPQAERALAKDMESLDESTIGRKVLTLWKKDTRQISRLWSTPLGTGDIFPTEWLPQSDVAFCTVASRQVGPGGEVLGDAVTLLHVDASARRVKALCDLPPDQVDALHMAPASGWALLSGQKDEGEFVHILDKDPDLGRVVFLPNGGRLLDVRWSRDGKLPYLMLRLQERELQGDASIPDDDFRDVLYSLNPATGELKETDGEVALYEGVEDPSALIVETNALEGPISATTRTKVNYAVLYPRPQEDGDIDPRNIILVAGDVDDVQLAPDERAVAYVSSGALFVRRFLEVPKQQYLEARETARRAEILMNGKQAALSIIMYSADYEGELPDPNGDWRQTLHPYTRSPEILQDLVLVYSVSRVEEIENPSSYVFGYTPGPGGYAVMYADGHVEWRRELPEQGF